MSHPQLTFRTWRPDDASRVIELAEQSPDLWRQLPERDDIPGRLCGVANGYDGRWNFAVCLSTDPDAGLDVNPIGNIGLTTRPPRIGWCSYWLGAEARGHGLATAALMALARFGFDELGLYRLELAHRVNNPASGRVAARAGFQRERIMRGELEHDGVRYDTALWSRLVTDPAPEETMPVIQITRTLR